MNQGVPQVKECIFLQGDLLSGKILVTRVHGTNTLPKIARIFLTCTQDVVDSNQGENMTQKNCTIELRLPSGAWERSWAYPGQYSRVKAQRILSTQYPTGFTFRIVAPVRKPYRRHAAITPLELRGAHRMLSSARQYIIDSTNVGSNAGFRAYQVLTDALMNVTRQLETL